MLMIKLFFAHKYLIFPALLMAILIFPGISFAQDSESQAFNQDIATSTGLPEEDGEGQPVEVTDDSTPIGIVADIIVIGDLVTSQWAVRRQMTFRIGDTVSKRDLDLSKNRILSLNGIYWYAEFTHEPGEEEGTLIITCDVRSRRTWFISPTQVGGVIGERNFLGTADTVTIGAFRNKDDSYYVFSWQDPQFLGGHNSMYVEGHILDSSHSVRLDDIYSTGESYLIDRTGFSMTYGTRWQGNILVNAGFKYDKVETDKFGDPFKSFGTDDQFFWSGAMIPDGNVGVLSFGLSGGYLNSRFFPTDGYYWSIQDEFSGDYSLSDFSFTRHTVTYAKFIDVYDGRNVLGGRVMYSYLTGDPPNYELLPFDWQVRGYTGGTHRGKSLLAMNFEYRFIAEPDIFQGVLFADMGRAWDGHELSLSDLEYGYGAGLRLYTGYFIPYNLLLRIDYGIGENGSELTVGFNQFF
jgi:outer membrane protein assembly factor BamA